jgi:arylsulfatase A-like enzyme
MKVIMVMFDSLNRYMLPPYGCNWTHTPNFARLAQRSLTFDKSYVCSMPCMPARRDLHTGRSNFLHRAWGPLEPFDDSVPQMLRDAGIYTHLVTDHYHYFEDGGATYHNRYNTWEFMRGQEGDPWIGQVSDPAPVDGLGRNGHSDKLTRQDSINRSFMGEECLQPQPQTFRAGLDFVRRNHQEDNWFLQIETFDPHEPFFSHRKYKDLYPHTYAGPRFDWPAYRAVEETPEQVEHGRYEYAALLSMCDAYLGDVLDVMDEKNMWHDTMLVVWTDHGFLLGEHDFWAKLRTPFMKKLRIHRSGYGIRVAAKVANGARL